MGTIMNLMNIAESTIQQYLPDNYEIDDESWCDEGFQIPIFDVSTIESSMKGAVDRFRFFLDRDETEAENTERFSRELQEYVERWRNVA